jgi:predicted kinase
MTDHTALSEHDRRLVEQIAQQRGMTFEEAVESLAKEGLAARIRRKTGRAPAKVIAWPKQRRH